MILGHFRQAVGLARAERLYSVLYIAGVALSITTVMVLSIILYSRLAPVYPEYNRARSLYVNTMRRTVFNGRGSIRAPLTYPMIRQWFSSLQGVEHVCAKTSLDAELVSVADTRRFETYPVRQTDNEFFNVYGFDFLFGRPFSADDMADGKKVAVVSDRTARRLFGSEEAAMGRDIEIGFERYSIIGVVRGASTSTPESYAEIYYPYSSVKGFDGGYTHNYHVVMLLSPGTSVDDIRASLRTIVDASEVAHLEPETEIDIFGQPLSHYQQTFNQDPEEKQSAAHYIGYFLIVGLVILIVPAMNLSGLIVGRMDRRNAEMGIRKTFGASRHGLIGKVIMENLVLTTVGGLIGMVFAWGIVYFNRGWIFSIFDSSVDAEASLVDSGVTLSSMFSPAIVAITFGMILLLNVLSSLIPAWIALRRPIVESLNEKR